MDASQTEAVQSERGPLWAWLTATFFGVGTLKPAPGTWGSVAAVLLWAAVAHFAPQSSHLAVNIALAALAVLLGIPAGTQVSRASGGKDPQFVVIDEVAGQLITLIGAPVHWKALLVGLILFRAFDITKPWPVRKLEKLPDGTGIMMDDVAAGVFGLIIMQLLLHFGILS